MGYYMSKSELKATGKLVQEMLRMEVEPIKVNTASPKTYTALGITRAYRDTSAIVVNGNSRPPIPCPK